MCNCGSAGTSWYPISTGDRAVPPTPPLFEETHLPLRWFAVTFALIALTLIRLVPGGWWRASVTLAVALCLIREIGGLIVPNPYMPTWVRLWHMFEVGWSNFVYGLAIAYVFLPHPRRAKA